MFACSVCWFFSGWFVLFSPCVVRLGEAGWRCRPCSDRELLRAGELPPRRHQQESDLLSASVPDLSLAPAAQQHTEKGLVETESRKHAEQPAPPHTLKQQHRAEDPDALGPLASC